jgi:hypothetical protein
MNWFFSRHIRPTQLTGVVAGHVQLCCHLPVGDWARRRVSNERRNDRVRHDVELELHLHLFLALDLDLASTLAPVFESPVDPPVHCPSCLRTRRAVSYQRAVIRTPLSDLTIALDRQKSIREKYLEDSHARR